MMKLLGAMLLLVAGLVVLGASESNPNELDWTEVVEGWFRFDDGVALEFGTGGDFQAVSADGSDLAVLDAADNTLFTIGDLGTTGSAATDWVYVGGGYGSTGSTLTNTGVISANGAITTDGALTSDSAVIGGGYGSTGCTISNAGAVSANGAITTGSSGTTGYVTVTGNGSATFGCTAPAEYPAYVDLAPYSTDGENQTVRVFRLSHTGSTSALSVYSPGTSTITATIDGTTGNIYTAGDCSALTFTDRSPIYTKGDALEVLGAIKAEAGTDNTYGDGFAAVDHKTLGKLKVDKVRTKGDGTEEVEEGRDLGKLITVNSAAILELAERVEALEARVAKLEKGK